MTEPIFIDRRDSLFGRAADIRKLLDAAARPGLTLVVGRPRMGKTWALQETARQLLEDGRYVVGYHDFKGDESAHLLYAVEDLYSRWLANEALRKQAVASWRLLKPTLLPRVGQVVGELTELLGTGLLPGAMAPLIKGAFSKLSEAQRAGGGLSTPALAYDEARQLVRLIADLGGRDRRVVLILDAFEKSLAGRRSDFDTIEAFCRNDTDWEGVHVFAAIRHPDQDDTGMSDYRRMVRLCRMFPSGNVHELAALDRSDPAENQRLLAFVRDRVRAAGLVTDERLLQLIDGYPGVVDHWCHRANSTEMHSEADLERVAGHAQANRYPDLEHALGTLRSPARSLAAALALLPALDASSWDMLREILLPADSPRQLQDLVDELIDAAVFVDPNSEIRFASYGHDTRHTVARRWFVTAARDVMRRESERVIFDLAGRFVGADLKSVHAVFVLGKCAETAMSVAVGANHVDLIELANYLCDDTIDAIRDDIFLNETLRRACPALLAWALVVKLSKRGSRGEDVMADYAAVLTFPGVPADAVSQALLGRGMEYIERGDSRAAMADLTALIELPGAPARLLAQALWNRGLAYVRQGDLALGIADHTVLITLAEAPVETVAEAYLRRGMSRGDLGDADGEKADYTSVIELPGAPIEHIGRALLSRALARAGEEDYCGALADYTAIIDLAEAPGKLVTAALMLRGTRRAQQGDVDDALADLSLAIAMPEADVDTVAAALLQRGWSQKERGETDAALDDFNRLIGLPNAPVEVLAQALVYRARLHNKMNDIEAQIADYTTVIELSGAPVERRAEALLERALVDIAAPEQRTMQDLTALIELSGAPASTVAVALAERARRRRLCDDETGASADENVSIALPGAPVALVARLLVSRAADRAKRGAITEAKQDCAGVINLQEAPPESVARAHYALAMACFDEHDLEGELRNYTALIELTGAPVDLVTLSLLNRGSRREALGDSAGAIADYGVIIRLPAAPASTLAEALLKRGIAIEAGGDEAAAMADFDAVIGLSGVPGAQLAKAFLHRGLVSDSRGDIEAAMADYTRAVETPNALPEQVAQALFARGMTRGQHDDVEGSFADYTALIDLPGAPPAFVAQAMLQRRIARGLRGDEEGALEDYTTVINLQGALVHTVALALLLRGIKLARQGDLELALADYSAVIALPDVPPDLLEKAREFHIRVSAERAGR
ncbi:tetratricopeptide repeat protein [Peristeroidobacter soli]|uniref:tetratricopeptide repeat protein n=1 Tax=Peristeroidobacter soli TaxID=2497877 RepID=UPI00158E9AC3|nr:tetratricopeptide repeat protein [Peristeroidobacter soli]